MTTANPGPGGITSREFTNADLEACIEVFQTNVPRFFTSGERDEFAGFLSALPGPYLVLVDPSDRIVACGGYALRESGRIADLCWGMVRQELHGRGLGKALTLSRIERMLDDARVEEIVLHTSQHTTGFYENIGFEIVDIQVDGYAPGLDRCDMRLIVAEDTRGRFRESGK